MKYLEDKHTNMVSQYIVEYGNWLIRHTCFKTVTHKLSFSSGDILYSYLLLFFPMYFSVIDLISKISTQIKTNLQPLIIL